MTSGPLLLFQVDAHAPGKEIMLGSGGCTVDVRADLQCFVPCHRLEVIFNGSVVPSREEPVGSHSMSLSGKIKVPALARGTKFFSSGSHDAVEV